ncbi:MAG: hypothetical protein N3Z28_05155 [Synechococcaceae cyanobacterium MAG-AL2]|jgi:hypothetical protein|uniref:hypothetical protein n=1 Tax=Candidatus Regnicoccus frigidus TaxID=3074015 RepID=UPI002834E45B|nr:hypothetical protein [Candidatus Regnicoccus frigidus]MCT4367042.1 hypothetical protein [Candidatus Regnicoccus frigidus MAG-AL2]
MTTPDLRQLKAIPESPYKEALAAALGVELPPEGVSSIWTITPCPGALSVQFVSAGKGGGPDTWVVFATDDYPHRSGVYTDGSAALAAASPQGAGIAAGQSLRRFMRFWGWLPEKERQL